MKIITLLTSMVIGGLAVNVSAKAHKELITINQFAQHPALDAVVEGFELGLKEAKLTNKVELIKKNAQGNIAISIQIAQQFASLNPKAMIAVATPAAQVTLKARISDKTLVGFAAVTDPKESKLEKTNVIGITDQPPLAELLDLVQVILPNTKRIGVIYNSSEVNSIITIKRLKELAIERKMEVIESIANSTNDLAASTASLISRVDVIYLPQDNTVASGITTISNITYKQKLPVVNNFVTKNKFVPLINNDPALMEKGVFLTLGCNYFAMGKQLSQNLIKRLNDNKDVSTNIVNAAKKQLLINQDLAKEWGIVIPPKVIKQMEEGK